MPKQHICLIHQVNNILVLIVHLKTQNSSKLEVIHSTHPFSFNHFNYDKSISNPRNFWKWARDLSHIIIIHEVWKWAHDLSHIIIIHEVWKWAHYLSHIIIIHEVWKWAHYLSHIIIIRTNIFSWRDDFSTCAHLCKIWFYEKVI